MRESLNMNDRKRSILRRSTSSPNCQENSIHPQLSSSALLSSSLTSAPSTRLPYYYPPSGDLVGQYDYGTFEPQLPSSSLATSSSLKIPVNMNHNNGNRAIIQEASVYHRYRYYNRLFNSSENFDKHKRSNENILIIPNHVIPWYFILPKVSVPIFQVENSSEARQSSIVTIFAIWNMMMGTSLLCLPWAYHQAGLLGGFLIILLMTGLCFFTASLVIRVPKILSIQVNEFTDLCSLLLGNMAHKISQISSLSILAGGCIVYWVLMSNFLRHVISFIYQVQILNMTIGLNTSSVVCNPIVNVSQGTDERYDHFMANLDFVVPVILIIFIGPITCLRSVNFFLKFNIIGTFSVFYLLIFAMFKAYSWNFINISFDSNSEFYVHLFDWNFPIYTGVLSLAMFIHNCLTTLLKTQKNPKHNLRDLAIAYILVSVTYLLISIIIYISFPLSKQCIKDNFLDNFESNDLFAFITRLFLLLQVLSLFPLLVYMFRVQVLQLFKDPNTGRISYPFTRTIIINVCLLTIGCMFAEFYPQIGTIIRYCGSFSGMILIFILPTMTFIKARNVIEKPLHPFLKGCLFSLIILGIANFIAQFLVHD